MTKYKRIIEEDENGNQKVIDVIKSTETIKVIPKKDPKQLAIANQKKRVKNSLQKFRRLCTYSIYKKRIIV